MNKTIKLILESLFDDDDILQASVTDNIISKKMLNAPTTMNISDVIYSKLGDNKFKGFKKYTPDDGYEYFESMATYSKFYETYSATIKKIIDRCVSDGWKCYSYRDNDLSIYSDDILLYDRISENEYRQLLNDNYKSGKINKSLYDKVTKLYNEWLNTYNKFYSKLDNKYLQKLFKKKTVKFAYISPDNGVVFYCDVNTDNYNVATYIITFTGEVDYSEMNTDNLKTRRKRQTLFKKLLKQQPDLMKQLDNDCEPYIINFDKDDYPVLTTKANEFNLEFLMRHFHNCSNGEKHKIFNVEYKRIAIRDDAKFTDLTYGTMDDMLHINITFDKTPSAAYIRHKAKGDVKVYLTDTAKNNI